MIGQRTKGKNKLPSQSFPSFLFYLPAHKPVPCSLFPCGLFFTRSLLGCNPRRKLAGASRWSNPCQPLRLGVRLLLWWKEGKRLWAAVRQCNTRSPHLRSSLFWFWFRRFFFSCDVSLIRTSNERFWPCPFKRGRALWSLGGLGGLD